MSCHAHPGREALVFTALRMAPLLGWSAQRTADEIATTQGILARHHARDRGLDSDQRQVGSMFAKLRA
jgi:hypothetical protein